MSKKNFWFWVVFIIFSLMLGACNLLSDEEVEESPVPVSDQVIDEDQTFSGWAEGMSTISQWAIDAEASSVYAEPEWGADKATGLPDAPRCGDYQFAWASAASDEIATLELTYETPVYVSRIEIVQSFNPNQVVKVELMDPEGEFITVYQDSPEVVDRPCPYSLTIDVDELDFKSDKIRITVDQSILGLGWNEIDAVLLEGVENKQ